MAEKPKTELQLMAEAIGQAIRENREPSIFKRNGYSPERERELLEPPIPKRHRKVACKSQETGAAFIACVVESKTFPAGRIVTFENYVHPAGTATYQDAGGLVPVGLQILRAGLGAPEEGRVLPKHDYTPQYLQWRWTEFWQKDLLRYAGKELKRFLVASEEAWNTPWQEGRVGPLTEDN